jgi:hypothetical protein
LKIPDKKERPNLLGRSFLLNVAIIKSDKASPIKLQESYFERFIPEELINMLNSDNPFTSGSYYIDLRGHILQRLRSANINDQVFVVVRMAFAKALEVDNIVLSRPEKECLLADVLKSVLEEMNEKLEVN